MNTIIQGVEELGVVFEKFGRTPVESRVFALLLLSEPPYQSFEEIGKFLGASKSAVSNALNSFQREGSVSYKTFSGDRKRYFMINTKEWQNKLKETALSLNSFNELLTQVIDLRKNSEHKTFNNEIKEILAFQTYLSKEMEIAIKKWEAK